MKKTLKQAITDKWLLVLNEYELIKHKKSKNVFYIFSRV